MRKPDNWDSVQGAEAGDYPRLPAGAYCCRITKACEQKSGSGRDMLVLELDIAAGEYAGMFAKSMYPPKYYQLTGGESVKFFKGLITAIEASNEGYRWDWDPRSLSGKLVAAAFGEEEYVNKDGAVAVSVKPRFLRSLEALRKGEVETPAPKRLNGSGAPPQAGAPLPPPPMDDDDDGDLPF